MHRPLTGTPGIGCANIVALARRRFYSRKLFSACSDHSIDALHSLCLLTSRWVWGDGRDRYRRITRYCLTISIYLLAFVVYTSAPKARYNYRFEITSSSSARYFTRRFESRRLHRCPEIQIRYYVRLRTNNSIVFQLASRLAINSLFVAKMLLRKTVIGCV